MAESTAEPISLHTLKQRQGAVVATSSWYTIDQPLISRFADATFDKYFIHTDPVRAKAEGPYGGTIAHGMLTLSLLSDMAARALPPIEGLTSAVNYGFDRIRFLTPVPSGSRVRAHFTLVEATKRSPTQVLMHYRVHVEIEGQSRHALTADWLSLIFVTAINNGEEET